MSSLIPCSCEESLAWGRIKNNVIDDDSGNTLSLYCVVEFVLGSWEVELNFWSSGSNILIDKCEMESQREQMLLAMLAVCLLRFNWIGQVNMFLWIHKDMCLCKVCLSYHFQLDTALNVMQCEWAFVKFFLKCAKITVNAITLIAVSTMPTLILQKKK